MFNGSYLINVYRIIHYNRHMLSIQSQDFAREMLRWYEATT